jgi:hypothetical protein
MIDGNQEVIDGAKGADCGGVQGDPLARQRCRPFIGGQETPFRSTVSLFWLDSAIIILLFSSDVRQGVDVSCAGIEFV